MPNAQEFSELIRTGALDFALLKPIDTQFLISLQRVSWSALGELRGRGVLLVYLAGAAVRRARSPGPASCSTRSYVLCGVAILYSLMISLAATSIWLGGTRRSTTSGSTSPTSRAIRWRSTKARWDRRCGSFHVHHSGAGRGQRAGRVDCQALRAPRLAAAGFALIATAGSLAASRWIFSRALGSYRSASS